VIEGVAERNGMEFWQKETMTGLEAMSGGVSEGSRSEPPCRKNPDFFFWTQQIIRHHVFMWTRTLKRR